MIEDSKNTMGGTEIMGGIATEIGLILVAGEEEVWHFRRVYECFFDLKFHTKLNLINRQVPFWRQRWRSSQGLCEQFEL